MESTTELLTGLIGIALFLGIFIGFHLDKSAAVNAEIQSLSANDKALSHDYSACLESKEGLDVPDKAEHCKQYECQSITYLAHGYEELSHRMHAAYESCWSCYNSTIAREGGIPKCGG